MKFLSIIYLMSVSLCASLCCPGEDDYFPTTISIENNSLISVQSNQTEYNLGDFIYLNTEVENEQESIDGNLITISDYDYGEVDQSQLEYRLSLYKLTGFGTIVKIPLLDEHIDVIEGNTTLDDNYENVDIGISCLFNGSKYKNITGIKLLESGTYFIGASYRNNNDAFNYLNGGDYNTSWISIKSKIVNANEEGFFEFTVN